MPASMSPLDRALWNVAEVASRYSDTTEASARRRVWSEIEAAVATAAALCARVPKPAAPAPRIAVNPEQVAAAQRMAEVLRQRATDAEQRTVEAESLCWEAVAERDAATAARAAAEANQGCLEAERDALSFALARAETERDAARATLERALALSPTTAHVQVEIEVEALGNDLDRVRVDHEGVLAVRATSWNLLPESLAGHLVPGARVLRQDGRLAALVAVRADAGGAMSVEANEQAGRLVALGFRVDWMDESQLVA